MSKPQKGTIYTLTDPRDERIRYVGKTKQDPLERLAGHLASASNPAMRVWFNALALQGLTPRIDAVVQTSLDRLDAEEQQQIERHAKAGHRLFNAPYYHRHIADLYHAAAPTLDVLKRDDVVASKVDEYAHRVYGGIAAASAAGRFNRRQVAIRVLVRVPAVTAVLLWHALAGIPLVRWVAKTALLVFGLWEVGFDKLVRDKVLPLLPMRQGVEFWHTYLARPVFHLAALALGAAVITSLASYASVREAATPAPRPSRSNRKVDRSQSEIAAAAAAALDAAVPDPLARDVLRSTGVKHDAS